MIFRDTSADTTLDNANMGMREDFERRIKARNHMAQLDMHGDEYIVAGLQRKWEGYQMRQPEIDALKSENERLKSTTK